MSKIKVPANVDDAKSRVAAALAKLKAGGDKDKNKNTPGTSDDKNRDPNKGRDAAKYRSRARELAQELENTKLTAAEKDAKIAELTGLVEKLEKDVADLTPKAKNWSSHENTERARLLNRLKDTPEEMEKVKKMNLPLEALREVVTAKTGGSGIEGGQGTKAGNKNEAKTLDELIASGADSKAINAFLDKELGLAAAK